MKDYYPEPSDLFSSLSYIQSLGSMFTIPNLSYGDNIIAAVNYNDILMYDKISDEGNIDDLKKGVGNNYLLEIDLVQGKVISKLGILGPRVLCMTISPDNKFLLFCVEL